MTYGSRVQVIGAYLFMWSQSVLGLWLAGWAWGKDRMGLVALAALYGGFFSLIQTADNWKSTIALDDLESDLERLRSAYESTSEELASAKERVQHWYAAYLDQHPSKSGSNQ